MSKKTDPNSQYRISIHKDKGYSYASTQPAFSDPKTGEKKYHRVHWGTVRDGNKFIPGKTYLFASLEERKKLIFPNGWDLTEADKLSGLQTPANSSREGQDENRLYGDIWLLMQIAEVTGVHADLMKTFSCNQEMVDAVLTLAIYLLSGKRSSYNQLTSWQRISKTPFGKLLSPTCITRLTESITEQNRMDLLRCRAARLDNLELCAVDSTSRSAWGDSLADIRYGSNKEHLPLPQTLEVVVYTLNGHMPVYYRTFPGNIPDSRSLQTILQDLSHAGFSNVVLITDRGYESIKNLEFYIENGQAMIMGTRINQKFVLDEIKKFGCFDHHPKEMQIDASERIYSKQFDIDYQIDKNRDNVKKSDHIKLNLYFDPARRNLEITELDIDIDMQNKSLKKILKDSIPLEDDKTIKQLYYLFKLDYDKTTHRLLSYSPEKEKIAKKMGV